MIVCRLIALALLVSLAAPAAVRAAGPSPATDAPDAGAPASPAAKSDPIEAQLAACIDKNGSTQGMVECEDAAYRKWDAELNRVYQQLTKQLPAAPRADLKASQKAWLAFRDSERKYIATLYTGFQGTMYRPMAVDRAKEVVRQRVLELRHYLEILQEHAGDEPAGH